MTFTTELTQEDHLASSLASEYGSGMNQRVRRRGWAFLAVSIIFFAFAYVNYTKGTESFSALYCFLLACFLAAYGVWMQGYYPRLMRKTYGTALSSIGLGAFEIALDDNGVSLRGELTSSRTQWGGYVSRLETDDHFFLYTGGADGHILPKRSMTPEQIEEARTIVAAHIPTVR